jgi:hypothetical protein
VSCPGCPRAVRYFGRCDRSAEHRHTNLTRSGGPPRAPLYGLVAHRIDSPVMATFRRISATLRSRCNLIIINKLRLYMRFVAVG